MPLKFINKDAGFAAFFITVVILAIMLGIAFSITTLALGGQRNSANIVKSAQSYYVAEAGIEDALLRLKKTPTIYPPLLGTFRYMKMCKFEFLSLGSK